MKTLQELWDELGVLLADHAALQTRLVEMNLQNNFFFSFLGASNLPWLITTVDTGGANNVGAYTSLAFGPDGQPAISYFDNTNDDLKFARKGVFKPAP